MWAAEHPGPPPSIGRAGPGELAALEHLTGPPAPGPRRNPGVGTDGASTGAAQRLLAGAMARETPAGPLVPARSSGPGRAGTDAARCCRRTGAGASVASATTRHGDPRASSSERLSDWGGEAAREPLLCGIRAHRSADCDRRDEETETPRISAQARCWPKQHRGDGPDCCFLRTAFISVGTRPAASAGNAGLADGEELRPNLTSIPLIRIPR
jgi:hypothetical protein